MSVQIFQTLRIHTVKFTIATAIIEKDLNGLYWWLQDLLSYIIILLSRSNVNSFPLPVPASVIFKAILLFESTFSLQLTRAIHSISFLLSTHQCLI